MLHLVLLSAIQGITEFLPVSSSGHLVVLPLLMSWPDQGLIIDVAVHVGTLLAVIIYFWRDIFFMLGGLWQLIQGRKSKGGLLFVFLLVATIPIIVAGYYFNQLYPGGLRNLEIIGWTTLIFGIVLFVTDRYGMTLRRIEHLGLKDVLFIGVAQILALVPGTSRSGITISVARLIGMERRDCAKFSMLLSMPVIFGAGVLKSIELFEKGDVVLTNLAITAVIMAFIFALLSIAILMAWLKLYSFKPFVIYRVFLGCGLLAIAYGWVG